MLHLRGKQSQYDDLYREMTHYTHFMHFTQTGKLVLVLLWLNLITLFPVRLSWNPEDSANGENVSRREIGDMGCCKENAERGGSGE